MVFKTTLGTIKNPVSLVNGIANTNLTSGSVNGVADVTAKLDGQTVHQSVTIDTTPPTANATPTGGLYNTNQTVTLKMSEAGTIYYTVNGTTPTTSSTKYTSPLLISTTTTLKFLAKDLAGNLSPIYTQLYTIDKTAPRAVINLTMTDNTAAHTAKVGDNIIFTINIHNNGPHTATNLIVKDLLPYGLAFISSPDGVYNKTSNSINWTIGILNSGSTLVKSVTVKVLSNLAGKTAVNWATEDQTETPTHTSTKDPITVAPQAVINLTMTDNTAAQTAKVGDNIIFTINIHNNGPNTATNLIVKDLLPYGLAFISSPDGVYNKTSNSINWTIGILNSGSTLVKTVTLKVLSNLAGKTAVNWATEDQTETPTHTSTKDTINIKP